MNYYISDLHLFHEASIRFDNRPLALWKRCMRQLLADGTISKQWRYSIHPW